MFIKKTLENSQGLIFIIRKIYEKSKPLEIILTTTPALSPCHGD